MNMLGIFLLFAVTALTWMSILLFIWYYLRFVIYAPANHHKVLQEIDEYQQFNAN